MERRGNGAGQRNRAWEQRLSEGFGLGYLDGETGSGPARNFERGSGSRLNVHSLYEHNASTQGRVMKERNDKRQHQMPEANQLHQTATIKQGEQRQQYQGVEPTLRLIHDLLTSVIRHQSQEADRGNNQDMDKGKSHANRKDRGKVTVSSGLCFACGQPGHIAKFCQGAKVKKNRASQRGREKITVSSGLCFNCGRAGHIAKNCLGGESKKSEGSERHVPTNIICFTCGGKRHYASECPTRPVPAVRTVDHPCPDQRANEPATKKQAVEGRVNALGMVDIVNPKPTGHT